MSSRGDHPVFGDGGDGEAPVGVFAVGGFRGWEGLGGGEVDAGVGGDGSG